jgi:hypothetical protein
MEKTWKHLLDFLKTVEADSPNLLNNPIRLEVYDWDCGETRSNGVEEIVVVKRGEGSKIILKDTNY